MSERPRRPLLSIAASRRCAPWYRVALMAAKLCKTLELLEPPAEAADAWHGLCQAADDAATHAAACVALVERLEARADAPEPAP